MELVANLVKALLYAINGGVDEMTGIKVIDGIDKITDEYLNYDKVIRAYDNVLNIVSKTYVDAMNIIHYMHDKYAYEASQMALHDTNVERLMAFGAAGLSVVVDSLSAIKYAKVKPIRNVKELPLIELEGEYQIGNDDDRVDQIAVDLITNFSNKLKQHKLYRDAIHTLSILTITLMSFMEKNGNNPDGRKAENLCSRC